jgi:hypothetical protein
MWSLNAGTQKPLAGAQALWKQTASVTKAAVEDQVRPSSRGRYLGGIRRITAPISSGVVRV